MEKREEGGGGGRRRGREGSETMFADAHCTADQLLDSSLSHRGKLPVMTLNGSEDKQMDTHTHTHTCKHVLDTACPSPPPPLSLPPSPSPSPSPFPSPSPSPSPPPPLTLHLSGGLCSELAVDEVGGVEDGAGCHSVVQVGPVLVQRMEHTDQTDHGEGRVWRGWGEWEGRGSAGQTG